MAHGRRGRFAATLVFFVILVVVSGETAAAGDSRAPSGQRLTTRILDSESDGDPGEDSSDRDQRSSERERPSLKKPKAPSIQAPRDGHPPTSESESDDDPAPIAVPGGGGADEPSGAGSQAAGPGNGNTEAATGGGKQGDTGDGNRGKRGRPGHASRLRAALAGLRGCLSNLSRSERRVLMLRAGLEGRRPHSRRRVAKRLKVSRQRVARLERRGLRRLRALARADRCGKRRAAREVAAPRADNGANPPPAAKGAPHSNTAKPHGSPSALPKTHTLAVQGPDRPRKVVTEPSANQVLHDFGDDAAIAFPWLAIALVLALLAGGGVIGVIRRFRHAP